MTTFQEKVEEKLKAYRSAYRVDEMNDANDLSTLMMLIRQEALTENWYEQVSELTDEGAIEKAASIKKLMDAIRDSTTSIINLQRTLNIDRKTRKTEEVNSPADYIRLLRRNAKDFMDKRIVFVYCPDCKVMVGRIYPVHDHTAYSASFQCSQCNKMIRARREERDVFFDVPDHQWRRSNRAEIVQPKKKKKKSGDTQYPDDGIVLGAGGLGVEEEIETPVHEIMEEVELYGND